MLDASHNLLTALPASLSELSELRELHLQNNRLEDLAADNWDALQNLSVLDLHQNDQLCSPRLMRTNEGA